MTSYEQAFVCVLILIRANLLKCCGKTIPRDFNAQTILYIIRDELCAVNKRNEVREKCSILYEFRDVVNKKVMYMDVAQPCL